MPYQHLAAITGSAAAAEILRDICGRMKLNGGADHDGHHWVYVSAREAGEAAGCCLNHAAKLLRYLVELGLVVREKLGDIEEVGLPWVRSWFYRPGPECPDWLLGEASTTPVVIDHPRGGRSIQQPTSTRNNKNRVAVAQKEQPHNIPDAEQTRRVIDRFEGMTFTPPSETQKTQMMAENSFVWDPSGHGSKQQHQAKTSAPQGFGVRKADPQKASVAVGARGHHPCADSFRKTAGSVEPSVAKASYG